LGFASHLPVLIQHAETNSAYQLCSYLHIHESAECRQLNAAELAGKSAAVPFSPEGKPDQQL